MGIRATIRSADSGLILEVRENYQTRGDPRREVVCKTFDEAVTILAQHLGGGFGSPVPELKIGESLKVSLIKEPE